MLKLYHIENEKIVQIEPKKLKKGQDLIWMDLFEPHLEEEKIVENYVGVLIPTREEMHEIELSSRLYDENKSLYMTFYMVTNADIDAPELHNVTFILTKNQFVTIRYVDPVPFRMFEKRCEKFDENSLDNKAFIMTLQEHIEDRVADILENLGRKIDDVSKSIFDNKTKGKRKNFEGILQKISIYTDLASKARESLLSISRMVSFLHQNNIIKFNKEELLRLETLAKDIHSISDHASFLANKVTFMLDATLGMISIEQNNIIKIFSVAAVVFLPPTLIASIYGMNFHHMPELDWKYGYPIAIGLMVAAAVLPYQFFKKKGWL